MPAVLFIRYGTTDVSCTWLSSFLVCWNLANILSHTFLYQSINMRFNVWSWQYVLVWPTLNNNNEILINTEEKLNFEDLCLYVLEQIFNTFYYYYLQKVSAHFIYIIFPIHLRLIIISIVKWPGLVSPQNMSQSQKRVNHKCIVFSIYFQPSVDAKKITIVACLLYELWLRAMAVLFPVHLIILSYLAWRVNFYY